MHWRAWIAAFAVVAAVVTGVGTPGWAHIGAVSDSVVAGPVDSVADVSRDVVHAGPDLVLRAAPQAPAPPWLAIVCVAAALLVGWRWPRRALALALVLLMAVFAFEDGLHSVHHGFDQTKAAACDIAAAGLHLQATEADDTAPSRIILPVVAVAAEEHSSGPATRFLGPDQGRAPPIPSA